MIIVKLIENIGMMNMKTGKLILLVTLLVLLVGVVSAVELPDETSGTTDSAMTEKVVTDTPTSNVIDSVESNDNSKITKEDKNIKSTSRSVDVSDFNTLHNALVNGSYNTVTVNVKSNIQLDEATKVNPAIKKLTINGNGKTIDGNANCQFLYISNGNVTIDNLKISNCLSREDNGGAIVNTANLSMTKCSLNNNLVSNYEYNGGAIYNTGRLTLINTTFNSNKAVGCGGAIHNDLGVVTIINSRINANRADDYGGAIYNAMGNITITSTNLDKNSVEDYGGALYNYRGRMTINNCSLNNNKAIYGKTDKYGMGGAIYNERGTLTIKASTLNNNLAGEYGGAIDNFVGTLNENNCTLNNNTATEGCGGAIFSEEAKVIVNNSILKYNTAIGEDDNGGAIFNFEGTITLTNSILEYNKAHTGAAVYTDNNYNNISRIVNCTINNNNAVNKSLTGMGAAIYNYGTLVIANSTINTNTGSDAQGGAIYTMNQLSIDGCIISNNRVNGINNLYCYGGAVYNCYGELNITNSTFNNNTAYCAKGSSSHSDYARGGAIYSEGGELNVKKCVFVNNTALEGAAIYNLYTALIQNNTFKANKAIVDGKAIIDDDKTAVIKDNINDTTSRRSSTIYTNSSFVKIIKNIFIDGINFTKTTVQAANGVIGEKLTLKATVIDMDKRKVNEGYVIFKLNGVTIKDNGKLSGSNNPLKVKVSNGAATATITADLTMRNANKLTATYIGTISYNASTSNGSKIRISQRNASIEVSSNVKTIRQGQTLTITARVYDTTGGKKSGNLVKYSDEYVYFKVNGITLKDSKGNMLKVKLVNGTATVKYTVPLGLSCVTDGKTMTPKNHTILAGFYNKNYVEDIRNTTTFQVERSNITITIANATVNTKTHKLSLTATIRDYLGNVVSGPNKCVIKINGVSLKNGTQAMYYYSNNGILKIRDITIPSYNNYKTIEIVTQDRLAYKSQRNTTTTIKVVK